MRLYPKKNPVLRYSRACFADQLPFMPQRLRHKMALHGFEANDDYGFQIHCLLNSRLAGIRCLNLEGEAPRLRTAFATALALALEYPHSLYHDFSQNQPPPPRVILPPSRDELGREEPPIEPFDDLMSEACALSEAEPVIIILDQLQAVDFREHIRIARFLERKQWLIGEAAYYANPQNLLLILISEAPLYHSLRKASYQLWVNSRSVHSIRYRPEDFGLAPEASEMLVLLDGLFVQLGVAPTKTEYERLLHDLHRHVRCLDDLCHSLYAWVEGIDRQALKEDGVQQPLQAVIRGIPCLTHVDQIELVAPV